MRRRFGNSPAEGLGVRAEINVTSLVDVAFTLLIIFMITAPILQGGIEVQVPRAPSSPLQTPDGIVVTVDRDGQIYVEDAAVTFEEFQASIERILERQEAPVVFVKGDENASYGTVLRVFGTLKEAGVEAVNLVAQPEDRRREG